MKRVLALLFVVVLVVAVVTACAPVANVTQSFVALPDYIRASITGVVIALVALVFDFAIGKYQQLSWLRKYQQEWALGLSAAFITWLENILSTGYENVSITGLAFLLALVAVFLPYLTIRKALVEREFIARRAQLVTAIPETTGSSYRPSTTIQYFTYSHLPAKLQEVSKPIGELADLMEKTLPSGPEKSAGMRKLLEAKDCFVRSKLDAE